MENAPLILGQLSIAEKIQRDLIYDINQRAAEHNATMSDVLMGIGFAAAQMILSNMHMFTEGTTHEQAEAVLAQAMHLTIQEFVNPPLIEMQQEMVENPPDFIPADGVHPVQVTGEGEEVPLN